MSQTTMPVKASLTRTYVKIFFIVFLLLAATVSGVLWAVYSPEFVRVAFDFISTRAQEQAIKLELDGLSGSLKDGIIIKRLIIKKVDPGFTTQISNLSLEFDFNQLLTSAQIYVDVDCEKLEIAGTQPPAWLETLPPFPEIGCLAHLPGNLHLAKIKIKETVITPFNHGLITLKTANLELIKVDEKGGQELKVPFEGFLRERKFISGSFDGLLSQKARKIEGKIDACLVGRKFVSEIVASSKKGKGEISGHIIEGTIDLALLSRWLIPLWQDSFPFGFDGIIKVGGSWLYGEEVGFLGNISGDFQKFRMVAQGLFITVFELNGNWKFFDGNLELEDSGSFFAGFPASLTGKIDSVFEPARKWNLTFKSEKIIMEKFFEDLPWGVKYGMGIPSMKGESSFNLQLRGPYIPEIFATLKTSGIEVKSDSDQHRISGDLSFKMGKKNPGQLLARIECASEEGLPGVFTRFHGNGKKLSSDLAGRSNLSFFWEGNGSSLANMTVSGKVSSDKSEMVDLQGRFKDGNGHLVAISEKISEYKVENLTLLQLLLGY